MPVNERAAMRLAESILAVLAIQRRNDVLLAPVWFEWSEGCFYLMTPRRGVLARGIRRNPHVSILVFGDRPYWGVEDRGVAEFVNGGAALRERLAKRYLGDRDGELYVSSMSFDPQAIRIAPTKLRTWEYPMGSESIGDAG